jgi:hypothetical protein
LHAAAGGACFKTSEALIDEHNPVSTFSDFPLVHNVNGAVALTLDDFADSRAYASRIGAFKAPEISRGRQRADMSSQNSIATFSHGFPLDYGFAAGRAKGTLR